MVLDCSTNRGFVGPAYRDAAFPEAVSKCKPGFPSRPGGSPSRPLLVPSSSRTTAEERHKGAYGYQYCGQGGLSWSIPYCTGVLALGWQLRPDLSAAKMKEILLESAYVDDQGLRFIDPPRFVEMVRALPA